jgi:hypothetical protein
MADIIEKVVKAGELPPGRRGDLDAEVQALVSVRRLTQNGFTEAFEAEVLKAEQEIEGAPYRTASEVIEELTAIANDGSLQVSIHSNRGSRT